jgi:hypothetical protein
MKKTIRITESNIKNLINTILESYNLNDYDDEDFIEVFLQYFRPWVKEKHGDEIGQYPISLLVKKYSKEFAIDKGIFNEDELMSSRNMTNIISIGKKLIENGKHELPNIKKEGLFTEKYKKILDHFIENLKLPDYISINFKEESPYKVNCSINVDWVKMIHDKNGESLGISDIKDTLISYMENYLGIEFGSPSHGHLDFNFDNTFTYDGVEDWVKNTLNTEIKKKIRSLPMSGILHSIRFETNRFYLGGSIVLIFKSETNLSSTSLAGKKEFVLSVHNLLDELGYNTKIFRTLRN